MEELVTKGPAVELAMLGFFIGIIAFLYTMTVLAKVTDPRRRKE